MGSWDLTEPKTSGGGRRVARSGKTRSSCVTGLRSEEDGEECDGECATRRGGEAEIGAHDGDGDVAMVREDGSPRRRDGARCAGADGVRWRRGCRDGARRRLAG
ncbi:hypothetical protein U1Q18_026480 [Sarracenia purpurea var. burkii]